MVNKHGLTQRQYKFGKTLARVVTKLEGVNTKYK